MDDEDIRTALAAAGPTGEPLAEKWFTAIRETHSDAGDSWSSFKEALGSNARDFDFDFDDNFVTEFFRNIEDSLTDPLSAVKAMAETEDRDLLTIFRELEAAKEQPRSTFQESLTWITGARQDRLRATLGDAWTTTVRATLDKEWPVWKSATDDQLVTFLDQWMPTILAAAPVADAEALLWTTGPQRQRLHTALGDAWGAVVRSTLDQQWPVWKSATDDQLVTFLDQWTPTILARATPAPAADVEALLWTTGAQRHQLLTGLGDAWPESVRATLDKEWPVWKSATDDQLVTFLDQWMHVVLAPARAPVAPVEEVLGHDAALIAQNPEFEKIDPLLRRELINQVLAEQVGV